MKHGRLIDADALMKDLEKWMKQVDPTHPQEDNAIPPMEDIIVSTLMTIEEQPTIEERKTARWRYSRNISSISYSDMMITCDQCGYTKERCHGDVLNFCPNCGADMRERREE